MQLVIEDPPIEEDVAAVITAVPCSVTLPAGAGKTELIAATAAEVAQRDGVSLVLTHTHAGVEALRRRMSKYGVGRDQVVVRTIDSWAYDLIVHFPDLAEFVVGDAPDWSESAAYHRAAARAARTRAVQKMLRVSYTNLFIDEYQDCLIDQHALVVALSETIPTAVFGDPLQSLFNFSSNKPVDWGSDVAPLFPMVEVQSRPRRWDPDHQALGRWLVDIRRNLLEGMSIDLASAPVRWIQRHDFRTYIGVCYSALQLDGTIAVLGQFRHDCVSAAGSLGGTYTVMEALDSQVPASLAEKIDTEDGATIAQAVVEFAVNCSVGLANHISAQKRRQLGEGRSFGTRSEVLKPAYEAVHQMRAEPTPNAVRTALEHLGNLPKVSIHCREAWDEVIRAVSVAMSEECTVSEALLTVRNHTRRVGRRPATRVVTRPLLVKGLEYDHVIILNPERYNAQELYVALTRGSKSVTVISDTWVLPAAKIATHN